VAIRLMFVMRNGRWSRQLANRDAIRPRSPFRRYALLLRKSEDGRARPEGMRLGLIARARHWAARQRSRRDRRIVDHAVADRLDHPSPTGAGSAATSAIFQASWPERGRCSADLCVRTA
jgi:hypothetical protein